VNDKPKPEPIEDTWWVDQDQDQKWIETQEQWPEEYEDTADPQSFK